MKCHQLQDEEQTVWTGLRDETGTKPVRQERILRAGIIELIRTSLPAPSAIDVSGEFYYDLQGKQDQAYFR